MKKFILLIFVLISFKSQAAIISVDFVASAMDMGGLGLGRYSQRDGAGNFTFNTEGFSSVNEWSRERYLYQDRYNSELASLSMSNRNFYHEFNLRELDPTLSYQYERSWTNVHVIDGSVNLGLDMFQLSIRNDYRSYDATTGITHELYEFMYVNIESTNPDFIIGGTGGMPVNFDEIFLGDYRGHGYLSVTDNLFKDTSDPRYLEPISRYGARSDFQIAGFTNFTVNDDETSNGNETHKVPLPPTFWLMAAGLVLMSMPRLGFKVQGIEKSKI